MNLRICSNNHLKLAADVDGIAEGIFPDCAVPRLVCGPIPAGGATVVEDVLVFVTQGDITFRVVPTCRVPRLVCGPILAGGATVVGDVLVLATEGVNSACACVTPGAGEDSIPSTGPRSPSRKTSNAGNLDSTPNVPGYGSEQRVGNERSTTGDPL